MISVLSPDQAHSALIFHLCTMTYITCYIIQKKAHKNCTQTYTPVKILTQMHFFCSTIANPHVFRFYINFMCYMLQQLHFGAKLYIVYLTDFSKAKLFTFIQSQVVKISSSWSMTKKRLEFLFYIEVINQFSIVIK